ncbi:alpha/beta hydrolase family protein [Psychrobacillus sp. NPDC096426]|uniref:alpha/beta hydrolase family protein n=1 Tax=Psychrobacillus sp. NPDC096426 TaxID=3364491 RepID=UPI00380E7C76
MTESFSILCDQVRLSGVLHLPDGIQNKKVPLIVLLHGFVGSKVGEHRLFVKAARNFSEKGYAVFRFDFSGCGESDGDYADVTVTKQLKEVQVVLDYVSNLKEVDANNIILIGHSLGGAVASLTAAGNQQIRKLILWSPVAKPYEDIVAIVGDTALQTARILGLFDYNGFYVSQHFLDDLKSHHPLEAIRSYEGQLLVIHAAEDEDVPKENAVYYTESLKRGSTVNIRYIKEANHTFASYSFEEKLFEETIRWLEKSEVHSGEVAL